MARAIDANALAALFSERGRKYRERNSYSKAREADAAQCIVRQAPTIEAEPVRHGRWIEKQTTIQCSNCGKEYNDEIRCMCYGEDAELNHCPKCGAKMDEKE